MSITEKPVQPSTFSFESFKQFAIKAGPRAIVAGIAGYYSLGIAYEQGLMAEIDKIAIIVLKNWVGYAGIGALMPTFQWYAAWGVRIMAAAFAAIIYDLIERVIIHCYLSIKKRFISCRSEITDQR